MKFCSLKPLNYQLLIHETIMFEQTTNNYMYIFIYIVLSVIGVCLAISSLKLKTTMNTVFLVNNNGKQTPFVRHIIIKLKKKYDKKKENICFYVSPKARLSLIVHESNQIKSIK